MSARSLMMAMASRLQAASAKNCEKALHEVIAELPAEARTLIQATYFEGQTLQDAAKRIGISKAWASRLHVKTLQRLANALRHAGVAD